MYLLGMGSFSSAQAGSLGCLEAKHFEYDGLRYIGSFAPLFVHQYSQAWFDFRGKRDRYADYFQNSAIATDVHRRFCVELGKQFPTTATTCGASPLPIPTRATWFGAARPPWDRSTARWFPAPPAVRCRFCRNRSCASAQYPKSLSGDLEHVWIRECF